MAKEREQQVTTKDTVSTEVGVVHVMPVGYQGGKLPEGSRAKVPKAPAKHEVKVSPPKKASVPKPAPKVKRPAKKPPLPKKNPHKKRVLMIVGGVVMVVLLIVILSITLSGRGSEPEVTTSAVIVPEPPVVVTPDPTPEPDPVPDPVPEPDPFIPPEPSPGRDTDSDGLSDVEERLYGSNVRLPDTDRDGFLDGNEVFHRYDPTLPDPATLLDRGLLTRFEDQLTFLHPTIWEETVQEGQSVIRVVLTAPSSEKIMLAAEELPVLQPLEAYLENLAQEKGDTELLDVEYSVSKTGSPMAVQKDQMRATLMVNGWVVTAEYDLGSKQTVDFVQTFQMLINSIDVVPEVL